MKKAHKAEVRRREAQAKIQSIDGQIQELQKRIPNAEIIERGKIEDYIRKLEKMKRKLR
ncbi:MAG: hypothetical protein IIA85_03480 [Nanoarchaeota archaeon]|nr:hypothetical protein [Nanoarchaeota archaeon]